MNSSNNLKELLEKNLITKEEYDIIIKRMEEQSVDYEKTWGEVINGFYDWCQDKYSLVTAKGYKTCLYKFVLYMTKKDTNEVALGETFKMYTFRSVNGFFNKMENDGFSSQAISKTKYALVVLGKYLESLGTEVPNISDIKISINKTVNKTTIALRQDEIIKIANCGELRNKVCIMLCYEAALRRIELMNLKVSDFNFEKRQLFIYNKDNEIDRVVILSEDLISCVQEYIEELYDNIAKWNISRVNNGRAPREDFGYIFQSVKMVIPSYSLLQVMVKTNAETYYKANCTDLTEVKEKVKLVTFETIRNSRKVYLLSQGVSTQDVMQLSGDKNYMSTHRFSKLVPLLYPEQY